MTSVINSLHFMVHTYPIYTNMHWTVDFCSSSIFVRGNNELGCIAHRFHTKNFGYCWSQIFYGL